MPYGNFIKSYATYFKENVTESFMQSLTVRAAAKINLSLQITGTSQKLHTLDMLTCSVDMFERVKLTKQSGVTLSCNKAVPTDNRNTAYRMAELFFEHTEIDSGVAIEINKTVPIGAGMGGGSADAAAVLVGLNSLYGTNLSTEALLKLGLRVGSDVPVCIMGGLCRVTGVGGDVEQIKYQIPYSFVGIMGGKSVSTAEAYRRFDEMGPGSPADTEAAIARLKQPDFISFLKNDLEYSSTLKLKEIKSRFIDLGASMAMMTGSGAVVYGMFNDAKTAQRAAEEMGNEAFFINPFAKGVEILG